MHIIGWIIVIVLGLCSVSLAIYMVKVCLSWWSNKKLSHPKGKKKNMIQFAIALVILIIILTIVGFVVKCLWDLRIYSATGSDEGKDGQQYNSQYLEMIAELPFHDEVTNEEETIWQHLIYKELFYDRYLEWEKKSNNFDKLRDRYGSEIYNVQELRFINIEQLSRHVNMFYGSDILPATDKNLKEVDDELKKNADIELYQNEFWLRAKDCNVNSSDEQLYYVGVAADNVFKELCKGRDPEVKQVTFYGSMAVAYYLAGAKYYEGNFDLILLYYRISEIYIYLEKYVDFGQDGTAYREHFLLMAEIFLMLAETEYGKQEENGDIHEHEKITYFGHYYAEILYKFIVEYGSEDEELVSMCQKYATQYLDSPYTKDYEGGRKSCEDILTRLEKMDMGKRSE